MPPAGHLKDKTKDKIFSWGILRKGSVARFYVRTNFYIFKENFVPIWTGAHLKEKCGPFRAVGNLLQPFGSSTANTSTNLKIQGKLNPL